MADNDHIKELLPALALGSLEEKDESRALAHLAGCPECRTELND